MLDVCLVDFLDPCLQECFFDWLESQCVNVDICSDEELNGFCDRFLSLYFLL